MLRAFAALLAAFAILAPASAQDRVVPYWATIDTTELNMRVGPSREYRIDWVYKRRGMPLEVTAEYGHWRRVRDVDGAGGWVHYSLISGVRTVLVEEDMLELHSRPGDNMPVEAKLAVGVIAKLGDCTVDWCEISAGGYEGWAHKAALWGVDAEETRD